MNTRFATGGLLVVAVVGVAAGMTVVSRGDPPPVYTSGGHLTTIMSGAEAIVVVRDLSDDGSVVSNEGDRYHVTRGTVVSATITNVRKGPEWPPQPKVGEAFMVRRVVGGDPSSDMPYEASAAGRDVVLIASHVESERDGEFPTPWIFDAAAIVEDAEALEFIGPLGDERNEFLAEVASHAPELSDLDLLQAWLTNEPAVLEAVKSAEDGNGDSFAAWYDTPVHLRPLDPDLTPPEVLRDLTRINAKFTVTPIAAERLAVDTPMGVAHVARMDAGSHSGELLLPAGGWMAVRVYDEDPSQREQLTRIDIPQDVPYGVHVVLGPQGATIEFLSKEDYRRITVDDLPPQDDNAPSSSSTER